MADSFFEPDGGRYIATPLTRGPWHQDFQHAGPPSALLAHAIEAQAQNESQRQQVVRLGIDLFKPIPIAALRIDVTQRDGGRRRRVVEAVLIDDVSDTPLARAQALLLSEPGLALGEQPNHDPAAPQPADECALHDLGFFRWDVGYHTAMELRLASGSLGSGQSAVWMRQRVPLLPNETPSGLQRLMAIADSGNGVSMVLNPREFSFVNPDLTVNIRRPAQGEWICLDARTHFQPGGLGMAESRLWDANGLVANGTQNLLAQAVSG